MRPWHWPPRPWARWTGQDQTLEYLRKQFGVPIGSFQALQHRMADLLLEVEQARSAVINAASAIDEYERLPREKALSAAKYSIGRIGTLVAEETSSPTRPRRPAENDE